MLEIWKSIENFENSHAVSNLGRVKVIRNGKERILKTHIYKGYRKVTLSHNSINKNLYVHRLVASAFCPGYDSEKANEVNHIDENKLNNTASNLEWCNRSYNMSYGTIKKRRTNSMNGKNSKRLKGINVEDGSIIEFDSLTSAEKMGFSAGTISGCCKGKYKQHAGYFWEYPDEKNDTSLRNHDRWKSNRKRIKGTSKTDGSVIEFDSLTEAKKAGFHDSAISVCLKGDRKSSGGYIWELL